MGYAKRPLLVSLPAAAANLGLMFVWMGQFERLGDTSYWGTNPLGSFFFFYGFSYLITAFGLSLLVLVASPFLSRFANRFPTIPLFIGLGGLLGWGLFAWTPNPSVFASCGALTAVLVALFIPSLFGRGGLQATSTSA